MAKIIYTDYTEVELAEVMNLCSQQNFICRNIEELRALPDGDNVIINAMVRIHNRLNEITKTVFEP